MARRATLRASDADRERVTKRLQEASTEGRLAHEELEQRVESALSARTYGELDVVLADLPAAGRAFGERSRRQLVRLAWARPALLLAIAVPVAVAITIAVVFAITGVLAVWALWALAGWWLFGRRRRRFARRYVAARGCGRFAGPPRVSSSRGSWV
jgi:DUF1707 SHOCT-like domain